MFKRAWDWLQETITSVWARVLCYGGAILLFLAEIAVSIDPALFMPYLKPHWIPFAMIVLGILTEIRRRFSKRGE